jgi:hypothetical protein
MRVPTWRVAGLIVMALALLGATGVQARAFPDVIDLPNGWLPEGVATGRGPVIYSGSRATGSIYAADLRTGDGRVLVPGQTGRVAVGLAFDKRTGYLYVAGGATGQAYVYDTRTGAEVASYQLTTAQPVFINDVIVTRDAAYFTNSAAPEIYRVPLDRNGEPGDTAETIPLGGDWQQVTGFNANGIEATPNGTWLIIVNSTTGLLYRVDPATGVATEIDLGGATVTAGDGLLLQGKTLYVVQNRFNQIAVVRLDNDLTAGEITGTITDADFDVPTTVARFGSSLYAVNGRFTTPPTPQTEYQIVRVSR